MPLNFTEEQFFESLFKTHRVKANNQVAFTGFSAGYSALLAARALKAPRAPPVVWISTTEPAADVFAAVEDKHHLVACIGPLYLFSKAGPTILI